MTLIAEFGQMDADHITEMVMDQVDGLPVKERIVALDELIGNLMYVSARLSGKELVESGTINQGITGHTDRVDGRKSRSGVWINHVRLYISNRLKRFIAAGQTKNADRVS